MTALDAERPVAPGRPVWRLVRWIALGAALLFAAITLRGQWEALQQARAQLRLSAGFIVAASLLTLATYGALVHAWRLLTAGEGAVLPFGVAARIWSIANLGRYVPGKVWSIIALGALAREAGVSATLASTAAIAGTVINLGLGFAIVGVLGARALEAMHFRGGQALAIGIAVLTMVGLLAAPALLPRLLGRLARLRGSATPPVRIPAGRLAAVAVINALSWCGYGLAFHWLCRGIGVPGGDPATMIAVFSASYLAGYLALPLPGGLVVREAALVAALTGLGVMGSADATLAAVSSRLWLTVLEVLPGCVALALRSRGTHDSARRA
jgi:hypothetical protein